MDGGRRPRGCGPCGRGRGGDAGRARRVPGARAGGLRQLPHAARPRRVRHGAGARRPAGRGQRRCSPRSRRTSRRPARSAAWSDAELARAIREGIRPDGTPDRAADAVRACTRVSATTTSRRSSRSCGPCRPVENDPAKSEYRMPLPPAWGPPVESVAAPERGPTAEYGAYLAGPVAHCMECHTPMGPQGPMLDTALGQGGFEFHGPWGVVGRAQHHLERGRAGGLQRRRHRGDDHRGGAAGRVADAAADAVRPFRADDAATTSRR